MDMKTIATATYLFCGLLGWGAAWTVIPSAAVYALLHKWKKGTWSIPYSFLDVAVYVAIGYVWYYTYTLLGLDKGWENLLCELVGLGGLFGLLLFVRVPFVWRHPDWRLKFAFSSAVIILLAAMLVARCVPYLGGAGC